MQLDKYTGKSYNVGDGESTNRRINLGFSTILPFLNNPVALTSDIGLIATELRNRGFHYTQSEKRIQNSCPPCSIAVDESEI